MAVLDIRDSDNMKTQQVLIQLDMRAVSMKPKLKNPHFSITHWYVSIEFGIIGYYDLGRLPHAGSSFALCYHNLYPRYRRTGQTDRRTLCS